MKVLKFQALLPYGNRFSKTLKSACCRRLEGKLSDCLADDEPVS